MPDYLYESGHTFTFYFLMLFDSFPLRSIHALCTWLPPRLSNALFGGLVTCVSGNHLSFSASLGRFG